MSVIPCEQNKQLRKKIKDFAETLKTESHTLGDHGLDESEFYNSGLFRGAIERIRGQFSATMREKREFVSHILNYMQDQGFIAEWESAGEANRHDYAVQLNSGRTAIIELKGCLDGNNTNIFERPPHAHEFIIWSVCTNPGADPRHNAWSGIHTRLSAEIISRDQRVDGIVIWDMVCGTIGRPCPKIASDPTRRTELGQFSLPPPCLYLLPSTIPSPRNNPMPQPQALGDVQIMQAFNDCFGCLPEEISYVNFDVGYRNNDTLRTTRITRNSEVQKESEPTAMGRSMTTNDQILLNEILSQRKEEVDADASDSDFFELFTAEQILKDFDLSYEEIESGLIGGGNDGGIDALYVLVNGELVQEESNFSKIKNNIVLNVIIVQAKTSPSFSETPIERFFTFSAKMFDLSVDVDSLKSIYNESLIRAIKKYRDTNTQLASKFPDQKISFYYASKGIDPSLGTTTKGNDLKQSVTDRFSNVVVDVEFVGSKRLLELARRSPQTSYTLTLAENPISSDGQVGFVCLIGLVDFYHFLKDSKGDMHRQIFEANVRDYQGRTVVNDEIQRSLRGGNREDFWWLNNGVSIIAAKASQSGKTITVEDPQIVNGLQTSTEIFNYCKDCNVDSENRKLLVRIVVPSAAESRDMVIKATNSQTSVKPASLRATDKIHRDIEEYLRPKGLYYDRRKNFYKNQGKPRNKIIGIPYLAQAVMSIVLGQPNTARARPSSLLKKDDDYVKIFNEIFPITLYYVCAEAMYRVTEHFKAAKDSLSTPERNDLRFYVVMHSVRSALGKKNPSESDVASFDLKDLTGVVTQNSLDVVKRLYEAAGANDKVAKGADFAKRVKDDLT